MKNMRKAWNSGHRVRLPFPGRIGAALADDMAGRPFPCGMPLKGQTAVALHAGGTSLVPVVIIDTVSGGLA